MPQQLPLPPPPELEPPQSSPAQAIVKDLLGAASMTDDNADDALVDDNEGQIRRSTRDKKSPDRYPTDQYSGIHTAEGFLDLLVSKVPKDFWTY